MAFQQLDHQQIETHVQVLGWLHVSMELLSIGLGLCFFTFYSGIGLVSGDANAATVMPFIGTAACSVIWLLSIPGLIAGVGLLRRQPWSRPLAMVVGFFDMMWFPLGTILGLYTFWVLLQESAEKCFAGDQL
ncbi:MAG: hypothetical protein ACK2UL_06580 [Anaerolineae bacterium]